MIAARRAGLLVAASVLAHGCSGPQWMMDAAGPAADSLAALGWFVIITFLVTTGVMWGLLWTVAVRRPGSLAEHAPPDEGGGMRWVLVGGFIIPAVVLSVIFVLALQTMSAFPMPHQSGDPDLRVIGRQWWWEAQYFVDGQLVATSPTEIHVPVGRPVQIALNTRDVIHSFWVPKLQGKVDLIPGMTNYVRIQASAPGVYRGECAEYCGMQHAHMILFVVAQPEDEYQAWLAAQQTNPPSPDTASARRGRDVFMRAACPLCHTIAGTRALASVGPDLTHVASRIAIAGGMLDNNRANMQAWVTHAQSLKPGSLMPDLTAFTGDELNDLVDYLQTLK